MNVTSVLDILLVVLLIGWLGYRQSTWRPVVPSRLWRTPIVLAAVGVFSLARGATFGPMDLAVLVIELVLSLGVGAWMGALAHFRVQEQPADGAGARVESRTGWWGMALWILLVAARVGIDVVAASMGAAAATGAGVILLVFAANRAARGAVVSARLARLSTASLASSAR